MKQTALSLFFQETFLKGPQVAISFIPQKQGNFKIILQKSNIFTASFFVDLEPAFRKQLLSWLFSYSQKKPTPILNLPRQFLPPFSNAVLTCLERIPFGSTLSYGEIALEAKSPKAARAVGTICRLNPWPLFIPCHRVLPKGKGIGAYAFGSSIKQALLEFEGSI